jgi:UDP-N-acetylglucosamine 2-epimerase
MPDWVLVYGDTNSTLAGALAACKLCIPCAHIEAGLRSFNREMSEEHNRVLTDRCSDLLFCPTQTAVNNLAKEGIHKGVHLVGDTMYDAVLQFSGIASKRSTILEDLGLKSKEYLLATIHRPQNADVPENLQNILTAFLEINEPIVFPIHPRTKQHVMSSHFEIHNSKVLCIPPVGYLDMLMLEQNARAIFTDSGGVQKEAHFFGVPCFTMRTETEWIETVELGWNVIVGADRAKIVEAFQCVKPGISRTGTYGDGKAAEKIVKNLMRCQNDLIRS